MHRDLSFKDDDLKYCTDLAKEEKLFTSFSILIITDQEKKVQY